MPRFPEVDAAGKFDAAIATANKATAAQAVAGTDNEKWVTSAGLLSALPVRSVKSFGAVGNGTTDDTAAIQAAIDFCVGGTVAAGASTGRTAVAALYFPPGTYKTTAAPKVVSVLGFQMFGASSYQSTIQVSGARTYGIELDGLFASYIHDLHIKGTQGLGSTDTVRDAIALNWTTAAARSTSNVTFARILINELKFTNGITLGLDSAARQVDDVWLYSSTVSGQWTVGETTWWQTGYQSGSGINGNILNHHYVSCGAALNRYNVYANAVNVTVSGGDFGSAEVDFRQAGSYPLAVDGLRSENSNRMFTQNGGATYAAAASFSNILWNCSQIHADGRFIRIGYAGSVFLENVILDRNAATPTIRFEQLGTTYLTAVGLQTRTAIGSLYTAASGASIGHVTSLGYSQIDSGGIPIAGLPAVWVKGISATANSMFEQAEITGAAGGGFVDLLEQSADPAAGATNHARLFAKDNGSGKTQLVVRFPTGATQVIATEP
jgi:hypothetical protein